MSQNHRYRPLEEWMKKGTRVRLSNNTGTISTVTQVWIEEGRMAATIYVKYDGQNVSYPFSPWDMERM